MLQGELVWVGLRGGHARSPPATAAASSGVNVRSVSFRTCNRDLFLVVLIVSLEAVAAELTPMRSGGCRWRVHSADHVVELVGAEDAQMLLAKRQRWMRSTWLLVAHWNPPGPSIFTFYAKSGQGVLLMHTT